MKVLSLFDGISCARVALEKVGIEVESYYASEIDPYAIQISNKHHIQGKMQVGSVVGLTFQVDDSFRGLRGKADGNVIHDTHIDLLIGGSPCQDLSIAKSGRKGLDGERSGLFWEYVRILKEVKPKYFILENVASMSKEAKQTITDTMRVEPIMIDAQLVSGQRRKRLFWTNIKNVELPIDRKIMLRDILEVEVDEKYYVKQETLKKILKKLEEKKPLGQAIRIHSADGKSVTLSALGGGTGAKTGLYVINIDGSEKTKSNTLRTSGMGSGFGDKHNWDQIAIVTTPRGNNKGGISQDKSPTLTSSSFAFNHHLIEMLRNGTARVRRLTPVECERLQGLPDFYTDGMKDNQRYKCLGNAFNADVIAHILTNLSTQ